MEARNNGKIKHIGVSIYNNEDLLLAAEDKKIDLIQLPYNLLDNDKQRGNLIAIAKANNKIVHTRSAFLQGLFFKDTNTFPKKLSPLISELENIKQLTEHHNLDMATLALKYATTNHNIDNVLIGVDSPEQLASNIQAVAANELSSELIHKIDSIAVSDIALLNPSNWS
jgi:aryl-alcohol dehydrogenase-like predicted oxidoreductase